MAGERNYHIFYQLLAMAQSNAELRLGMELGEPEDYFYTSQSDIQEIAGVDDKAE